MPRTTIGKLALMLTMLGCLHIWLGGMVSLPGFSGSALAAELNVEGLPSDPKAFRTQVDQILSKVDNLIEKLKGNKDALPVLLDLQQTRDNVVREIYKVENAPDGAKWTQKDMRESVEAMLKLLKAQYEKASGMAS